MTGEQYPPSESKLPGLPGFHPYDLQPWLMAVAIVSSVLGTVSTILRLLSRCMNSQKLWWDDYMMVFSGCWSLVALGFMFIMYSHGLGIHADVVYPENIVTMLQWLIIGETLYAWALSWVKLSVLLMYYRIFHIPYFKYSAWVLGLLVAAWVICVTFLFVFACVPVEKLWYPHLEGHCIDQIGTWVAHAAATILTDVLILLLPISQIWKLNLRRPAKIGLYVTFGLGFFVVFASAYRTRVLLTYDNSDLTYTLGPTVGWTAIEISAAIVSGNLPTMLPLLNSIFRRAGMKSHTSRHLAGRSLGRVPDQQNPSTGSTVQYSFRSGRAGSYLSRKPFNDTSCTYETTTGMASGKPPTHIGSGKNDNIGAYRCTVSNSVSKSLESYEGTDEISLREFHTEKYF